MFNLVTAPDIDCLSCSTPLKILVHTDLITIVEWAISAAREVS